LRKRIVIDWIRNISKCDECGEETESYAGFWITNSVKHKWCDRCGKVTANTIVAHEIQTWEEIKDLE